MRLNKLNLTKSHCFPNDTTEAFSLKLAKFVMQKTWNFKRGGGRVDLIHLSTTTGYKIRAYHLNNFK